MSDQVSPELLARCAELKEELVQFGCSARFSKALDARRRAAEAEHGGRRRLDEHETITLIDRFIHQERQEDGRTVLEAFVAVQRDLSADERAMLLGWGDVLDGCFEVRRTESEPPETVLHNLFDGLDYRAYATRGPSTFDVLDEGTFVLGRLVPLAPLADAWLVSGHLAVFEAGARQVIAQGALQALTQDPRLMRHNPALWERGWELQAQARANFVELYGEGMGILDPADAKQALETHFQLMIGKAAARGEESPSVAPKEAGFLPDEVMAADSIALVYDEIEGLVVCAGVRRLDELFADPAGSKDRAGLNLLGDCLRADTVPPVVFRHLVQRNPEGAQAAFRALLGKSGFTWERDGEKLLRRYKPAHFDVLPAPTFPVVSPRLQELLEPVRGF